MSNKVSYVKNEEPAFIKAFKQKTGYKEGPTIDSKREELNCDDEDRSDNEDEKPTIVVLKDGDLTAEEAELASKDEKTVAQDHDCEEPEPTDGKITFKKPTKRQSDTVNELTVSSSKKQKDEKKKKKSSSKEVKNSSLLSFGDEDDDET